MIAILIHNHQHTKAAGFEVCRAVINYLLLVFDFEGDAQQKC